MSQQVEKTLVWSVALVALLAIASCGRSSGTALGPSGVGASRDSSLTAVDVKLPNRNDLKTQVADIESKMNAYQLVVQASGCTTGMGFSRIGDYKDSEQLAASLTQGCDYLITMSLGNKDAASTTALKASYYSNSPGLKISKADIEGKAAFSLNLALNLMADGQAIGLKPGATPVTTPATSPVTGPVTSPVTSPTTTLAPDTQIPANLAAAKNLKTTSGQATTFAEHFKGKYIVLDFASSGCGPCVSAGQDFNSSPSMQKLLDGSVCSHATIVESSDASRWDNIFKGTPTGQHSLSVDGMNSFASNSLKTPITGTPFFVILDRSGAVKASFAGANVARIKEFCPAN